MRRCTTEPPRSPGLHQTNSELLPVQERVFKSLKLWTFYCDLEESLGSLDSAQAVYNRMLDLRIASPQIILNFALLLQENKLFEALCKDFTNVIFACLEVNSSLIFEKIDCVFADCSASVCSASPQYGQIAQRPGLRMVDLTSPAPTTPPRSRHLSDPKDLVRTNFSAAQKPNKSRPKKEP